MNGYARRCVHHTVPDAVAHVVFWAVEGSFFGTVHEAMGTPIAVDGALFRAVFDAEEDGGHPNLDKFLKSLDT
jgi:hypothetical protein